MTPQEALKESRRLKKRKPELEEIIIKDAACACSWAQSNQSRWPEAEDLIKQNPKVALDYALYVIEGRWPEAEPYILKDPKTAVSYARYVIHGAWPEAEPYIAKDAAAAQPYACGIINKRFPEAEDVIKKDPLYACYYSILLKFRFEEAEPYIAKHQKYALEYATHHKFRFEAAEKYFTKSNYIFKYAKYVLKSRFHQAEKYLTDHAKVRYFQHFQIPLDEELYNKELSKVAFQGKKSNYLNNLKKIKEATRNNIRHLIKINIITQEDAKQILDKLI